MRVETSRTTANRRREGDARGNVLLFALLVMTTVIVGSVGLGSLIMSSLQQTKTMDNGIVAYYAAESGVEDALYVGRKGGGDLPVDVTDPVTLSNGASWTRTVASAEDVLYFELAKDTGTEITLYDPDDIGAASGIARVTVDWDDSCEGCSMLRASMVGWDPGSPVTWTPNAQTFTYGGGTASISLGGKLSKLRLRAMNADLENIRVRAYDADGGQVPLPGRVVVDAVGDIANVQQKLTVTMPRRVPLTGIFDFVIFSECSLVKGGPASCP